MKVYHALIIAFALGLVSGYSWHLNQINANGIKLKEGAVAQAKGTPITLDGGIPAELLNVGY